MNDEQLIEWATTAHAPSAAKLGEMYKLSDQRISNWKRSKQLPSGWREYFMAQYEKTGAV